MQTNIPAEITDVKSSGLKFRINGAMIDLSFSTGRGWWGSYDKCYLNLDGFYLNYTKNTDVMSLLRAVHENNREHLVLSKLTSILWNQYATPILRSILHGETNASRVLRSVYLSLTHKQPRESRRSYLKIKELLPEAWNLFRGKEDRRYLVKLMDFETHLIARGIKG